MITQEQLSQVYEYAELFFTLEEISILTRIDIEELRREVTFGNSPLNEAYWYGKMTGQVKMRKQVKEWAKKGSADAEKQLAEWLSKQSESE